jgi:hypothetical protein
LPGRQPDDGPAQPLEYAAAGAQSPQQRVRPEQARIFAGRLEREAGPDPAQQVARAFGLACARPPDPFERAQSESLIRDHGVEAFCRALLNASEFLFVF